MRPVHIICIAWLLPLTLIGQSSDYVGNESANCVYLNFNQFQSDSGWVLTTHSKASTSYSVFDHSGQGHVLRKKETWGKRVDGQEYVQIDKVYSPISYRAEYMPVVHKPKAKLAAVGPMGVTFRVKSSNVPEYYVLEMSSGLLYSFTREFLLDLLRKNPDLLEQYKSEPEISIENDFEYLLKLNNYLDLISSP